jgi:hypothetical protein
MNGHRVAAFANNTANGQLADRNPAPPPRQVRADSPDVGQAPLDSGQHRTHSRDLLSTDLMAPVTLKIAIWSRGASSRIHLAGGQCVFSLRATAAI